ncbi:MAG: serine/threonine protein kinase [Acidobacteria bacterium]|nr:serine/threonine protein kinase [Acidobacteriota bacterium]
MEAGQRFGAYHLVSLIGAGGMGEVWKAEDESLRRTVAIKILPAANAQDRESNDRFKREARTAAQLNHPNIATIFSIDQFEDRAFIVMEYVDGEPLSKLILGSRLNPGEVIAIARSVADALAEAHEKGIVHRDIKPDNVVVSGRQVKVLDFGIAKRYGLDGESPGAAKSDTEFRTQAGIIVGTVQYMSPEQAMGKKLDGRSDIFSLGVVMYEALTGKLPFVGDSPALTLTRIIRDDPPHVRVTKPGLSPKLGAVVMRCLEKDPVRRFQNAHDVVAALDERMLAEVTDRAPERVSERDTPTAIAAPRPSTRSSPRAARTVIEKVPQARRSSSFAWIVAMIVLVIASIAATAFYLARDGKPTVEGVEAKVRAPESSPAGTTIAVTMPEAPGETEMAPTATLVDVIPAVATASGAAPGVEGKVESTGARPEPPLGRTVRSPASRELPPNATIAEQADYYYDQGLREVERRQPLEAYASFNKVVALEPDRAAAWVRAGELALFLRSPQEAVDHFRRAATIGKGLDERDALTATFGRAIANSDVAAMDAACEKAPFDRVYNELRRMATKRGATDCPAPIGVGLEAGRGPALRGGSKPGSAPSPRPIRKP